MKGKVGYALAVILLIPACWMVGVFMLGAGNAGLPFLLAVASGLSVPALVWVARRVGPAVWMVAGLLVLAALFLPDPLLAEMLPACGSESLGSGMALTQLGLICAALILAALLVHAGLTVGRARQGAGLTAAVALGLGALLLAKALHSLYWFLIWDSTTDPLGALWLPIPALAVLFGGIFLCAILPGRAKGAGVLYLLLIPGLIWVFWLADGVDFRQLTEARAERVSQAIGRYYSREGRYPHDLGQLIPGYSLSLPGPVILYGQGWCYDGGDGYYRLGYVSRQHWSDPRLSGQVYSAAGEAPDLGPLCAEEVAAIQARYPHYPYQYWSGEE